MNFASLSLNQAPAISIPLRFFITAPIFAMIAMVLWLINGPELMQDRWLPQTLAFTHLMTLGFITMTMMGALFQLLPVISGGGIFAANYTSTIIHALLTLGVASMGYGFYNSNELFMQAASIFLGLAFAIFLPLLTHALFTTPVSNDALRSMRVAVLSLWIASGLGLWLLLGHSGITSLARQNTPIHLAWAAIGWINVMIISIAYQVIPMFQVTHDYPKLISRWLTPGVFILLIIWSLLHAWLPVAWPQYILTLLICLFLLAFISITVHLQMQRKKALADANLYFWFAGIAGLFFCMLLFLYAEAVDADMDTAIGMAFIFSFVVPIINGMLYKIVPFLVWLHLTRKLAFTEKRKKIPTLFDIISHARCMTQFGLHVLALILTLLSFIYPAWFFYPAVVSWLVNFFVFWLNIVGAVIIYRKTIA
ncbi:MAG: hypothetical protein QG652_1552 [Pseudomonadota bacterium]|nr:hypothetical protein [Pseudomonadota bacterium]